MTISEFKKKINFQPKKFRLKCKIHYFFINVNCLNDIKINYVCNFSNKN